MTSHYYSYTHTVTFAETNLVGNVYFAHYAAWQGRCRERFILDYAPALVSELTSGELALVTLRLEVDFLAECYAGDQIEIRMSKATSGIAGANKIAMRFEYLRAGMLVAVGEQVVGCMQRVDSAVYRPCAVPADLLSALHRYAG